MLLRRAYSHHPHLYKYLIEYKYMVKFSRGVEEENGRIVVICEDVYTAKFINKEYGEKIRKFCSGREVEFTA